MVRRGIEAEAQGRNPSMLGEVSSCFCTLRRMRGTGYRTYFLLLWLAKGEKGDS